VRPRKRRTDDRNECRNQNAGDAITAAMRRALSGRRTGASMSLPEFDRQPHGFDVVAADNRDAVFSALKLQGEKIGIGFEIGIALGNGEKTAERPGYLRLRILEFLSFGIANGAGIYLDGRSLRARPSPPPAHCFLASQNLWRFQRDWR
jgi:hypothetical protein